MVETCVPPAEASSARSRKRAAGALFLISALILFVELACIRWFPANVLYLTFFTNTVLLACFLGMSLGCLAAGHRRNYLLATPLLLALAVYAGNRVEVLRESLERIIDVGQQGSPQFVYFGTEYRKSGEWGHFMIPIEALGGFFFLLIALAMVGPGQQLGRALTRVPNRLHAYTINILGSLTGILLFSFVSWLELPPGWWFSFIALGLAYFLFELPVSVRQAANWGLLAAIVALASATSWLSENNDRQEFWSPYYRVDYFPENREIRVNLIGHQQMTSCAAPYLGYDLPYLLNRDTGGRPWRDVLIIGAGSGNDVSYALRWNAQHIDAVEIDPRILALGQQHHPDQPYSVRDRVAAHEGDGRNFLRSAERQYDLIVYGVVDSLVLHSSYSNIRLESYLFTREAFADVKRCLKPDGVFVMYNGFRRGWIVARLHKALTECFTAEPLVFTLPYQAVVGPDQSSNGITLFVAGGSTALANWRPAFQLPDTTGAEPVLYWVKQQSAPGDASATRFERRPKDANQPDWQPFGPARVPEPAQLRVATDDWPYLYLREPMIPDLSLRGAAIMGSLALLLLVWFLPPRPDVEFANWPDEARAVLRHWARRRAGTVGVRFFDPRMFFLGAGFMLIETKAVVHMALLFGSTWLVNSVVFFAVLVMILLANSLVRLGRPQWLFPYYAALSVTIVLNAAVPIDSFLGWPSGIRIAASCLLVFAPVFFAAVIFAVSFGRVLEADRAFGCNIAGAMLGGLAEYSSLLLGFRNLEWVALAFYLLSGLSRPAANEQIAPGDRTC
jgi:spermidine synthase